MSRSAIIRLFPTRHQYAAVVILRQVLIMQLGVSGYRPIYWQQFAFDMMHQVDAVI
jgi:hypothetical protein